MDVVVGEDVVGSVFEGVASGERAGADGDLRLAFDAGWMLFRFGQEWGVEECANEGGAESIFIIVGVAALLGDEVGLIVEVLLLADDNVEVRAGELREPCGHGVEERVEPAELLQQVAETR